MGTDFSNIESWEIINKFYSRVFGIYNLCANRVGEEAWKENVSMLAVETAKIRASEKGDRLPQKKTFRFWGGSQIVNPYGQQIAKAAQYEEDEISGEISRDLLRQKRILLPYLRGDDPFFTYRELGRILHRGRDRKPDL